MFTMEDLRQFFDKATMEVDGTKTTLGAIKQFGQLEGTSAIALGYGRKNAGDCGTEVGTDMFRNFRAASSREPVRVPL